MDETWILTTCKRPHLRFVCHPREESYYHTHHVMPNGFTAKNDDSPKGTAGKDPLPFVSRRSPLLCRNGCVASSQPLASSIGLDMLRKGANAAEAAIAVAAVLCVTEPCSTGLGGDMFALYFDASTRKVSCINGSGASPEGLSLQVSQQDCSSDGGVSVDPNRFMFSPHTVTVPGKRIFR